MDRYILSLILLFVSYASTAETIYFAKPTSENAKVLVQHKEKANLDEVIWLVDPDTGDANRFLIASNQDKDSANGELVINVHNVAMSAAMQVFSKAQADNYKLAQNLANGMNGVEFDAYDWMIFQDLALELLLKDRFEPLIKTFEKQGELLPVFSFQRETSNIMTRETTNIEISGLSFTTKKGFTITFDLKLTGVGGFIVTVKEIKNSSGGILWPKSEFANSGVLRLTNASTEDVIELMEYIKVAYDYSFPNGFPSSVPKGSVIFIGCKSAINECEITIRHEEKNQ